MFDLPLIWAGLIATAVLLYVMLDGFDLGIGILFPFAASKEERDVMMNTVAPVWDGNETWLVLGGGGLMAAFPLAYSVLMPAFYLPVLLMLAGLILRGVAFEFRFRARNRGRKFWTQMFAGGSILTALAQPSPREPAVPRPARRRIRRAASRCRPRCGRPGSRSSVPG